MTGVATALYGFMNSFGVPAFVEQHIPDDARLPYITYTTVEPEWESSGLLSVRVWYYGDSFSDVAAKVDEISKALGGGLTVPAPGGVVFLYKENPFSQFQPIDNPDIRVAYVNIGVQALVPQ